MKRLGNMLTFALLFVGVVVLAAPITKIQVRRGTDAQLPATAAMGEPLFTTDTHRVFFGYSTGMEELLQRSRFQGYTGLQAQRLAGIWAAMAGKQTALGYTPVNTTDARLSDARAPLAHNQDINTVNGLQTVLDGKATLRQQASFQNMSLVQGNLYVSGTQYYNTGSVRAERFIGSDLNASNATLSNGLYTNTIRTWAGTQNFSVSGVVNHLASTGIVHPATAISGLATVATSGSYPDLANQPIIPVACGTDPATAIFDGKNATFRCSSTVTLAPGTPASVRNDGTPSDGVLKFSIPAGEQGTTGKTGSISVGTTTKLAPGSNPYVIFTGPSTARTANFGLVTGDTGTASITKRQVYDQILIPSTDIMELQPLTSSSDTVLRIRDANGSSPGNVRLYITGNGLLFVLDANDKLNWGFDTATKTYVMSNWSAASARKSYTRDIYGNEKQYDTTGRIVIFERYSNGREKTYYPNGKLQFHKQPDGKRITYRPDGITPMFTNMTSGATVL